LKFQEILRQREIEDKPSSSIKEDKHEGCFKEILDLFADPVVIVDGKGVFLEINDGVEKETGFSKQELLGKNFFRSSIVPAKSKVSLVENLAKRMVGMHVWPYPIEVNRKDGSKFFVEVNARKIEYQGKEADLVIFRNITERLEMEKELEELKKYTKHLENLVKEKTGELKKAQRMAGIGEATAKD
jgi:chemotaxis family two-component system sensor kinase Cph1